MCRRCPRWRDAVPVFTSAAVVAFPVSPVWSRCVGWGPPVFLVHVPVAPTGATRRRISPLALVLLSSLVLSRRWCDAVLMGRRCSSAGPVSPSVGRASPAAIIRGAIWTRVADPAPWTSLPFVVAPSRWVDAIRFVSVGGMPLSTEWLRMPDWTPPPDVCRMTGDGFVPAGRDLGLQWSIHALGIGIACPRILDIVDVLRHLRQIQSDPVSEIMHETGDPGLVHAVGGP